MNEHDTARERHEKAVEAWEHFGEEVPDEVLRAVSGAFALVACADGSLEESEIDAFLEMIKETRAFRHVNMETLEAEFRRLGRVILDDFEEGRRLALGEIGLLQKGHPIRTVLVVSAAQIAVVSNGKIDDAEESTLREICEALGLDPDKY
jgi:tellurite resistance protein